jgi:hypothetical protein
MNHAMIQANLACIIAPVLVTALSAWSAETAPAPRPLCFVFAGESNAGGFGLNKEGSKHAKHRDQS